MRKLATITLFLILVIFIAGCKQAVQRGTTTQETNQPAAPLQQAQASTPQAVDDTIDTQLAQLVDQGIEQDLSDLERGLV